MELPECRLPRARGGRHDDISFGMHAQASTHHMLTQAPSMHIDAGAVLLMETQGFCARATCAAYASQRREQHARRLHMVCPEHDDWAGRWHCVRILLRRQA